MIQSDILNVNQATMAIAVPEPEERGTALAVFAVLGLRCKLAADRKAKGKRQKDRSEELAQFRTPKLLTLD